MKKSKSILAATIGTIAEYYDMMLYVHFLFILSPLFFPNEDLLTQRLIGMMSFALGYIMRPLGGIFFGHIGDRFGRRAALGSSIFLISFPTFIIGILPSYSQIGITATIILLLCRLTQGFSVGGESIGASLYLVEQKVPGYQNTMSSLLNVAIQIGSLMGAALGYLCLKSSLGEWGWRIPFLMGALLGWMGYYIRKQTTETDDFIQIITQKKISKFPLKEVFRNEKMSLLRTMGICAGVMAPNQIIFVYMGDILRHKIKLPLEDILLHNMKIMLLIIVALLGCGYLADKIGFKKVMTVSLWAMILAIYPLFSYVQGPISSIEIMHMQGILALLTCGIMAPCCVMVSSLFPIHSRYSGYALGWSLGAILFAGLTPFLSIVLVEATGNENAPAFILIGCGLAALGALRGPSLKTT